MSACERLRTLFREEGALQAARACALWLLERPGYLACQPAKALPVNAPTVLTKLPRVAVQLHVFYPELLEEMLLCIKRIPCPFDCYISTDTSDKALLILECVKRSGLNMSVWVDVFPNRGRDVAPLLWQLAPVIEQYDYFLHLHTKQSGHSGFGGQWREQLLSALLFSPGYAAAVLRLFEGSPALGVAFPRACWRLKPSLGWKGNRPQAEAFMRRLGLPAALPGRPPFPAGDMFWARTSALLPLFKAGLTADDFPPETAQTNGTLAHCIERLWCVIARTQGYGWTRIKAKRLPRASGN